MNLLASVLCLGSLTTSRKWLWPRGQGWGCMATLLAVSIAFAMPALADAGQGLYWQCKPPIPATATTPTIEAGYCPVNLGYPLPVGQEIKGWAPVAGTQTGVTISASTALTIPATATVAVVQAQGVGATTGGQCAFWRDDGTAPTGTAGQVLVPNQSITLSGVSMTAFHIIAASGAGASCTMSASYYK